jgi:Rieske 2Fe-2S family protein
MPGEAIHDLRQVERSLPAAWYYAPDHHGQELERIWYRNWIYVARAESIAEPLDYLTHRIGTQVVLVLRDEQGRLRAFHNTCRHRGAMLCTEPAGHLATRRITCRYHGWTYTLRGDLAKAPRHDRPPPAGLEGLGLYPVDVAEWRGFVFVNLAGAESPSLETSLGASIEALTHWPLEQLRVGYTHVRTVQCNWKVFWENYNECLHCPGVHPALASLVPIYRRGIMEPQDDPEWAQHVASTDPAHRGGLRADAVSWTVDGQACGPAFANLTDEERRLGYHYLTHYPSMYIAAHVDYVRVVRLRPVGPEASEVHAQWLFAEATLQAPRFDLENAVNFAARVMTEDAEVCELTQQGQHAIAHAAGVLMPEEYDVHRFQRWVRDQLE